MERVDRIFTLKQIGESARERARVHVSFMNLERAYDMVNREVPWQALGMYDVGGRLFSRIKSIYVKSSVCKCERR